MSRYKLNKSEHDEGGNFEKLPEGEYVFQITDFKENDKNGNPAVTKAGDPMVNLTLEVLTPVEFEGKKIWHNVIFFQATSPSIKGIGMTRHFLHCCNLTWEGDLETDPNDFIGKKIRATVIHNGDYVNLDKIIMDETLFGKSVAVPSTPADIAWEE
jgi:hypothetical protein